MRPVSRTWLRLVAIIGIGVLLGACETTGFSLLGDERRAESMARQGRHADAADTYISMATQAVGTERDRLTLRAVEQWLDAGDGRRARSALGGVARPAGGPVLWLWAGNAAALALWEGQPDRALALLEPLSKQPLPERDRLRVEALRADAWYQKDDPIQAINLYKQRERWISDSSTLELSHRRLWAGLLVSDTEVMRRAAETTADAETRGWLTLAVLATSTGQQGIGWGNGVVRWQEANANHPAIGILTDLSLPDTELLNYPRQIALLLPLSGNNSAAGKAVKNGFFGAYFAAVAGLDTEQQIRVYDVDAAGGARSAYAQAVTDGAEFVVGPLLRRSVGELATEIILPVPVLTLNYLTGDAPPPTEFYQFALAPEDEAASAAQRAIADGYTRAVALTPATDWGRRVLNSFATEFEGLGGTLLDYRNYEPAVQDFAFEIEGLMALSQSVQRYDRLRANVGGPLQFDPRRRQDVDFIFLGADAKVGRLMKSQLKFHYSGALPVYATSFIYSLDGRSDSDLNGVMFADTPWVVAPPAWIADFPSIYAEYWPAEKRLSRLHAMGYDAYHLVGNLFSAREDRMGEVMGATGQLFLDSNNRVHRKLAWARFEQGKPVAMPNIDDTQQLMDEYGLDGGPLGIDAAPDAGTWPVDPSDR